MAHWLENDKAAADAFLHSVRWLNLYGERIGHSKTATLACGDVRAGHMVFTPNGCLAKVIDFWQHDESSMHMKLSF